MKTGTFIYCDGSESDEFDGEQKLKGITVV